EAAAKIVADARASAALRRDALQVQLLGQSPADAQRLAAGALARPEPEVRKLALRYLVHGGEPFHTLHWDQLYLSVEGDSASFIRDYNRGSNQPIVPKAPAGLTAGPLKPLLTDADPEVAAYAGYLLTLLGEADGLDRLLQFWGGKARTDVSWT